MKKVFMIAPYEALSGNASGNQELKYAENNNPAFEAPTGRNYARNYKPRYVISRRGDGTIYFSVKTKTATTITAQSKMNMALLGGVAAIKSALKITKPADWTMLHSIYDWIKGVQPTLGSFNQWLDPKLRSMLQYKQASTTIAASPGTVTIVNPWNWDASSGAILVSSFDKFLPQLGFTNARNQGVFADIKIDSTPLLVPFVGSTGSEMPSWQTYVGGATNPNVSLYFTSRGLSISDDVLFNGLNVYAPPSPTPQSKEDVIVADTAYTTIQPQA